MSDFVGDIHRDGAKRFGSLWLSMNQLILSIARRHKIPTERFVAFLTDVAWELCEQRVLGKLSARRVFVRCRAVEVVGTETELTVEFDDGRRLCLPWSRLPGGPDHLLTIADEGRTLRWAQLDKTVSVEVLLAPYTEL